MLKENGLLRGLVRSEATVCRDGIALACAYSAYLIGAHSYNSNSGGSGGDSSSGDVVSDAVTGDAGGGGHRGENNESEKGKNTSVPSAYRRAFELLCEVEAMYQESDTYWAARKQAAEEEYQQRREDYNSKRDSSRGRRDHMY